MLKQNCKKTNFADEKMHTSVQIITTYLSIATQIIFYSRNLNVLRGAVYDES